MSADAPGATAVDAQERGRSASTSLTWSIVGLGIYLIGVLMILLSAVSPGAMVAAVTEWVRMDVGLAFVRQGWIEFAANVVLFIPLGMLVTTAFRNAWAGVLSALVLSAAVEIAQMLLPGRMASVRDVIANVLGAAIGAGVIVLGRAIRRARRRARRGGAPAASSPEEEIG